MTTGFLIGMLIAGPVGFLTGVFYAHDVNERDFLAGRNHERRAHGEDLLVPAPELDDVSQYGIGSGGW